MSDTAILDQVQHKLESLRATVKAETPKVRHALDGFDMTPVTYQWQCHYCKRGFESKGVKGFKMPSEMVCRECENAYDAKVIANFVLEQSHKQAAYCVANLDMRSRERKEVVARWMRFATDSSAAYDRAKYTAMLKLIDDCDTGAASKPAPQQHKKGRAW